MTNLSQSFTPCPKPEKKIKEPYKGLKRTAIKKKLKEPTGELLFMQEVFTERNGICEVTGEKLEFSPSVCHHLLNKNNYKRFRTYTPNLIIIKEEIHFLYHSAAKEYVLSLYPNAIIIYDRMESLRIEYNQPQPTI